MRNILIFLILFLHHNIYSQHLSKGLMVSNSFVFLHLKEKKDNSHEKIYRIHPEIKWFISNKVSFGAEYQFQHLNFFNESTRANIDPTKFTSSIVKSASIITVQNKLGINSSYYFKLYDNLFIELEGAYLYGRNRTFLKEDVQNASINEPITIPTSSNFVGGTIHRVGDNYIIPNRFYNSKTPTIIPSHHSYTTPSHQFYTSLKSLIFVSKKIGIQVEIPIFIVTHEQKYSLGQNTFWETTLINGIKMRNLSFGIFYYFPNKKNF